jgi:hypothetical protein
VAKATGGKWTIRPNVASGGVASALVTLLLIISGLLQGDALDETRLKELTAALAVVLPLAFAYFAPKDANKTLFNAIGGLIAVIAGAVIALLYGLPVPETFQTSLLNALVALVNAALTGYVANTKPDQPAGEPG